MEIANNPFDIEIKVEECPFEFLNVQENQGSTIIKEESSAEVNKHLNEPYNQYLSKQVS